MNTPRRELLPGAGLSKNQDREWTVRCLADQVVRALAAYTMMFMGMAPLGSLFAGAAAEHVGAPWTVGLGGTAAIIGGIVFLRSLPNLRFEARELLVATQTAADESAEEAPAGKMP